MIVSSSIGTFYFDKIDPVDTNGCGDRARYPRRGGRGVRKVGGPLKIGSSRCARSLCLWFRGQVFPCFLD